MVISQKVLGRMLNGLQEKMTEGSYSFETAGKFEEGKVLAPRRRISRVQLKFLCDTVLLTLTQSLSPHSGHPTLGAPLSQRLLFGGRADNQEGLPALFPLTSPYSFYRLQGK